METVPREGQFGEKLVYRVFTTKHMTSWLRGGKGRNRIIVPLAASLGLEILGEKLLVASPTKVFPVKTPGRLKTARGEPRVER